MRASEPTLAAEFSEADPTVGACGLVEIFECLVVAEFDGDFGRLVIGVRLIGVFGVFKVFLVAGFAEVQFVHFVFTHLGDVQRGRFRTAAAFLHSSDTRRAGRTGWRLCGGVEGSSFLARRSF